MMKLEPCIILKLFIIFSVILSPNILIDYILLKMCKGITVKIRLKKKLSN